MTFAGKRFKLLALLQLKNKLKYTEVEMKAVLFPGQGSQKVGMGKDLVEEFVMARGNLFTSR